MPTAIVTGATGILGREIVKVLSSNPEEWSKTRSKKEDFPQNVVQRHLDLCATPEEMARELKGVEADYVFFAAYLEQDTEAKCQIRLSEYGYVRHKDCISRVCI
ncbi:hypothetical protein COL922a_014022 [Colletotrichum nupharicola]|nr:hypothetical protein COL922a_014022 [Colletotrichum nupharicola]